VTPWTRLPAIGTTLIVAPEIVRTRIIAAMATRQIFNFELHGIDFCDAEQDGIRDLVARQADLRVPIDEKLARLESILDELSAPGRSRPSPRSPPTCSGRRDSRAATKKSIRPCARSCSSRADRRAR
jgi:hypothetical protein